MKRVGIILKRALSDRVIKALKPAADGKQYIVLDTVLPKYGVRVTGTGFRTHVLVTRFPGSKNPTSRIEEPDPPRARPLCRDHGAGAHRQDTSAATSAHCRWCA
jgi:hypothetical protein